MTKKFTFLLLILVLFSACSKDIENEIITEENDSEGSYETVIVAFGDSLTQGYGINRDEAYPSQLQSHLDELGYSVKVYNSGLSGETTSAALERVDWVLQLKPDIVILTTGGNDAIRGIDLNLTKNNIIKIVEILEQNNVTVILSGMEIYENLGEPYTSDFKQLYFDIAEEKDLIFIPFFLEGVAGNNSLNIEDRIHPNKQGYEIVVKENILPVLLPILEN